MIPYGMTLQDVCASLEESRDRLRIINNGARMPTFEDTFALEFLVARCARYLDAVRVENEQSGAGA